MACNLTSVGTHLIITGKASFPPTDLLQFLGCAPYVLHILPTLECLVNRSYFFLPRWNELPKIARSNGRNSLPLGLRKRSHYSYH